MDPPASNPGSSAFEEGGFGRLRSRYLFGIAALVLVCLAVAFYALGIRARSIDAGLLYVLSMGLGGAVATWIAIATHALWNATSSIVLAGPEEPAVPLTAADLPHMLWVGLAGLCVCGGIVYALRRHLIPARGAPLPYLT